MGPDTFPTKGDLIAVKDSLELTYTGYGPTDKKWNIPTRELMELIDEAEGIQSEIDSAFRVAYAAPQKANIRLGINHIQKIGAFVPVDNRVKIKARSIMGTEVPLVQHKSKLLALTYGFYGTMESLDKVRYCLEKVKGLTIKFSMVEDSVYRLANPVKEIQERVNAPKNITIPHYEGLSKSVSSVLEEKEREEFTRLEVIKRNREKAQKVFMYTLDDLVGIITRLWSPEGCPWDRGQTFESLKKCLSDETQEVFQVIGNDDMEDPCEELGNMLLQVILNNQITKEEGRFTVNDVIDGLCRRVVRRHPHVLGSVKINSVEEGTALWDQTKMQEKVRKP